MPQATLVVRQEDPVDFIVANATGIEKGTLLKMTDPMTAIIATGSGDMLAGISAREKIASDGRTRLAVYRKGIFRMQAGGAILIGAPVMAEGTTANEIITATGVNGASVLGIALEAGAGSGDDILVAVNVGTGGELA